ncbi:MAG: hypothetical protein ACI81W_002676, partial [Saprospiraceae bacterium]
MSVAWQYLFYDKRANFEFVRKLYSFIYLIFTSNSQINKSRTYLKTLPTS